MGSRVIHRILAMLRSVVRGVSVMACLLSVALVAGFAQQPKEPSFELLQTNQEFVLRGQGYQIHITKTGFGLTIQRNGDIVLQSAQAHDAQSNLSFRTNGAVYNATSVKSEYMDGGTLVLLYRTDLNDETFVRVELTPEANVIHVKTWALNQSGALVPSLRYRVAPSGLWFGGGFQGWSDPQVFPLNNAHIVKNGFFADGSTQGTPAWYNTKGTAIWVRTPLDFRYSFNAMAGDKPDGMLFVEMPQASELAYDILIGNDIKDVVKRIVREVGYPQATPPEDYFRQPIFTTWVENKTEVSQLKVLEFAHAIRAAKIPAGCIEIDDKWEIRYGDMQFDGAKFPDPKAMVDELHSMGFKVTLWVHPFVNVDSESYAQLRHSGDLVADRSGDAGLIRWWQGIGAVWDFTNPAAATAYRARLAELQSKYGFDGFKFDGGDVNLVPRDLKAHADITSAQYADIYNREAAAHFPYNEARVGVYSQPLGIVQRLIDKQSIWSRDNGLAAIIPEALNVSMRGYPYVMPDMVGGNQYKSDNASSEKIDKELMIRWAQASALMPLLQFSVGPWHFDDETVRLCREAAELHVKFAPYIYELAQRARTSGEPIIAPLWYAAPADPNTYQLSDEFMLGNDVVVAPVVVQGAVSRDVYLPDGEWRDLNGGASLHGGWHRGYAAPINVLPVFVREGSSVAGTQK
jgi:myogenesis-regulating glycosidase